MLKLLATPMKNFLGTFHVNEKAQDAFEYLLIIGGVSVAVVIAVAAGGDGLITYVIGWVEDQVDTIVA